MATKEDIGSTFHKKPCGLWLVAMVISREHISASSQALAEEHISQHTKCTEDTYVRCKCNYSIEHQISNGTTASHFQEFLYSIRTTHFQHQIYDHLTCI